MTGAEQKQKRLDLRGLSLSIEVGTGQIHVPQLEFCP